MGKSYSLGEPYVLFVLSPLVVSHFGFDSGTLVMIFSSSWSLLTFYFFVMNIEEGSCDEH